VPYHSPGSVQSQIQVRPFTLLHPNRKVFIDDNITAAEEFNVSLNRVNWLGNIMACTFIPAAALTPWLVSRYGVRRTVCHIASTSLFRMIRDNSSAAVRTWFHLLGSRCLDPVCWHRKIPHCKQSLRSPHHWSSASHNPLTTIRPQKTVSHTRYFQVLCKHSTSHFSSDSG